MIYTPWKIIRKLFDVKLSHMRSLVEWLLKKGDEKNLTVTSKLRSRKETAIIRIKSRNKLTLALLEYLKDPQILLSWKGKTLIERTVLIK